tara:strand:+ start:549 stop:755 length:207 start_codon:yes stop_codon:yes gene_type:complete
MQVVAEVAHVQQPPVPEVQVEAVLERQTVQHPEQQDQQTLEAGEVAAVELLLTVLLQMVVLVVLALSF